MNTTTHHHSRFTALFKYTKQISNKIASALTTLSNISYWGFNVEHTYCESKQMLKLNYTPSTRPQKDVIRKDAKVKGAIKQPANRCSIFANNQNSEEQQKHKKQQLLFWEKAYTVAALKAAEKRCNIALHCIVQNVTVVLQSHCKLH